MHFCAQQYFLICHLALRLHYQFPCMCAQAPESEKRTACDKLKCYIQGSLDFTLLRKTTFLLFCISGLLQKFVVNCYVPHTVNWALAAGVPRYLAVWAVSTLSCATTVCRIFVSLIADREFSNRLVIYAIGLFFEFLMCIPLLVFPGISGTFMSVVLFGLHAGSFVICTTPSALVVVFVVSFGELLISSEPLRALLDLVFIS